MRPNESPQQTGHAMKGSSSFSGRFRVSWLLSGGLPGWPGHDMLTGRLASAPVRRKVF
jgi:hypothetical protein